MERLTLEQTKQLKPGDKVRCIDDGYLDSIRNGELYTVCKGNSMFNELVPIELKIGVRHYHFTRFSLVEHKLEDTEFKDVTEEWLPAMV